MVELPGRTELAGILGLVFGFVVFVLGGIAYATGSDTLGTVALVIVGGLVGFAAAGYLVVYYHLVRLTGG